MSDCHRRIEHFLHVLVAVDAEAAGGPLTAAHGRALEASLRYFAIAAPKHTADEEESLFPRLRDSTDSAAAAAMMLVERLERDHEEADGHHAAVAVLVQRWLAEDYLSPSEAEARELRARLARLQVLYRRHITVEDQELFPAAARVLDSAQLRQIGREMAARRERFVPTSHWPETPANGGSRDLRENCFTFVRELVPRRNGRHYE